MNFLWNGKLAQLQDDIFTALIAGQEISDKDYKKLKGSIPVKIAEFLAPSNLVVRNYCLIDLISGQSNHIKNIEKLCLKICHLIIAIWDDELWSEGHSYWGYTRYILKVYGEHFDQCWILDLIKIMNNNFRRTSYERNGVLYPAPFGDIWDIPLENELQQPRDKSNCGPVKICLPAIIIATKPLGFNLHTDSVETPYDTSSGVPMNMTTMQLFKFYKGYKEKYPTIWSEIRAMFSISRLISVCKLILIDIFMTI